jgi:glyceraldehyde 3-phosphate dehydrogenase
MPPSAPQNLPRSNMVKLAINGFGRIGRAAFKIALDNPDVEVVAVNDLAELETLAYLLRYDSVYGKYGRQVTTSPGILQVDDAKVKVLSDPDPENLPWKDLEVDVVIESTGFFTKRESAAKHLTAGARKVIISAPTKSEGVETIVLGVNDDHEPGDIISNASCTTNCATPVVAVLDNIFGIEKALLTTIHSYTSTQSLVDGPDNQDLRRGRAAAENIIPTSTGAAIAATKAYPPLMDKFDGVSVRVPTPVGSISDIVALLKEEVTVDEVNQAFKDAESNPSYRGVLGVTEEPVVSSDFIGDPRSAIVDLPMTRVVGGNLIKVLAWYDNEWGYSNRLIEQAVQFGE